MANDQQFWIDSFEMVEHVCLTFFHVPVIDSNLETLHIKYNTAISIDNNFKGMVVVETSIELWLPDNDKPRLIIRSSDQFRYLVRDLDTMIVDNPENDQKMINNQFIVASIIGLAFSTLRGILIQKLKGTLYQHVILPPFNAFTMAENFMRQQSA